MIPDGFHWNDIHNATENAGNVIADTLAKIEQAPKNIGEFILQF